ncbi:uncharacterized protein LOC110841407 isoform X3 [Zootermopsis nevadensis]|uniref:uncharacterized protein LOC110841407 isoform X3 n=1 Tax=Zootermopsis nevadensis TaxID=136037 RepID=UPI000B8E47E4|nr:uncharacterized protein LOC110841407 isoform X3 [Zootermopsis nevadensis]
MSYMLGHLHNGWQVDQAILSEEDRVVVIRFGHDWDPSCMKMDEVLYSIAEKRNNARLQKEERGTISCRMLHSTTQKTTIFHHRGNLKFYISKFWEYDDDNDDKDVDCSLACKESHQSSCIQTCTTILYGYH